MSAHFEKQPFHGKMQWVFNILILVLVGQSIARLAIHSIPDALRDSGDLKSPYLSARAWGAGIDPYSRKNISAEWDQVRPPGAPDLVEIDWLWRASLYPPSTLAMIYPLTFVSWKIACAGWLVLNILISVGGLWALIRLLNLSWSDRRTQFLGAAFVSLGPLITCIRAANPTLVAVMACVLVLYFARLNRSILAGIILGLAVTLKPQLAGAMLIVFILLRQPKICIPALSVAAFFVLLGVGRLSVANASWIPSLHANLALSNDPGRINDASRLNPFKWALLNIQVPLYEIFSNRRLVNLLAWGIVGILIAAYLMIWKRLKRPVDNVLLFAVPLVVCLLPIYHRYYDALVLIFPLGWAVAHFGTAKHRHAVAIFLCTLPFYVSSAFILESLKANHHVPSALTHSAFWDVVLMPMETWALIGVSILTMHRIWLDESSSPDMPVFRRQVVHSI